MSTTVLTGKQRRQLRALGHHLHPTVQVGKEGVSEALLKTAETELTAHELVKVKVLETAPDDPKEVAEQLAKGTSAHVAQVLGRTLLIFRADPKKPRIQLVSGRSEG